MSTVTVVIPNHNYGHWIRDAIKSVVIQDYPNKQIVIIDDGSTDNSIANIMEFAGIKGESKTNEVFVGEFKKVPIILCGFAEAGGPSRARNLGIKLTWNTSEYYAFLDADDVYKQTKLSKSIKKLEANPEYIGAVYTDYDIFNIHTGKLIREFKEPFSRERLVEECIVHSSCVVSKLALDNCGLYDEEMRTCEDYDLWMRISEKFCISHIPESLMVVRNGDYNSTSTVKKEIWQKNWERVVLKAKQRINNNE